MLNRFFRSPALTRRLLLALLLSLLLHGWLIGGLDGWLTEREAPEASLIRVELLPPPAPKPVAKPPPKIPQQVSPRHVPRPVAREKPVERPAEPPAPLSEPAEPATQSVLPPLAAATPAPQPADEPVPAPPAEVAEPAPKTPSKVSIDYQIVRKGGVAGTEHHSYLARPDGSYTLTSLAEAKGLLALALSDLVQRSEGQVTDQGLRPVSYLYQYGRNADKAQKASFDWQGKTLLLETGSRRQTLELEAGTQDMLSFMYQFMFVPPLQQMQLVVTSGKKLKTYNYGFEGEETLTTKMGPLRTMRIGKSNSDGEEKTEIWLAADYHYLPVKISKTEKDGTVTERIATHLQIDYDTTQ